MKTTNLILAIGLIFMYSCNSDDDASADTCSITVPADLPDVSLAVFSNSTNITNIFYGPASGKIYVYEAQEVGELPDEETRLERISTTKVIKGITCITQRDRVYKDEILIEDTDDWLAQDDDGNLWYFGEDVKNYDESGNFLDDEGSFEYGVDCALPGYWLPANPVVGQTYHQEYYEDVAEDKAEVIRINQTVTIGLGTYTGCLVTRDVNPLDPEEYEIKSYAPNIGFIKAELFDADDVLIQTEELVEIIE